MSGVFGLRPSRIVNFFDQSRPLLRHRAPVYVAEITQNGRDAMKFVERRPFADPEAAARKLMEIANSIEPVQDGRIHIELKQP
jgi:hypothetical protein